MRKFLLVLMFSLAALVVAACSGGSSDTGSTDSSGGSGDDADTSSDEKIVIKFSHVTTADSVKGQAADKFKELVEEKTDGKVEVEVYPSSQLYGDNDELDALVSGNVHMIAPSVTKMVKLDPRWQFVDMPYLFEDQAHVHRFFESELAQDLMQSDQLASNDIMGLVFWENGFKHFMNNKHALVEPSDYAGLKFRAQAGKVLESQFQALDAGSATIAFGETYAALQQGTVDGTENTFNNIDTQNYQEVQSHMTVSEHGRLDYAIFVNKSFWEGMPDDVRGLVEEALEEATELAWDLAAKDNAASFENIKDSGNVEVTELTDDQKKAMEEAFQPVYEEFTDVITEELLDGIRDLR